MGLARKVRVGSREVLVDSSPSYQLAPAVPTFVPEDRNCMSIRFTRPGHSDWYGGAYQETGWYRIAIP